MRCPDCSKFVSLENNEPEINDLSLTHNGEGQFAVTLDCRHVRACAECSTELKSIDISEELNPTIQEFDGFDALSEAQKASIIEALDSGEIEVDCDEGDVNVEESGGGRYKKNLITVTVGANLTLEFTPEVTAEENEKITLTHAIEFKSENAASYYEECC